MLPLTYCRKTVVKGGMVSHVGYHDTISVKVRINFFIPTTVLNLVLVLMRVHTKAVQVHTSR
jgi:hypothetical protein